MNIPRQITLKWLRETSEEAPEVHGHSLSTNAHLLAVRHKFHLIANTARLHAPFIKGKSTLNALQLLCLIGSRHDLVLLPYCAWKLSFLTKIIPKTGRTPLQWLASRNLLDAVVLDHQQPKDWVDHLPALRTAVQEFEKHSASWVNDEQFGYTGLREFIEQVEDEQAVRSLTPANCVRLLPLLRYVKRHGYIPKCDELIEKSEKLARIKARENIKLDTDES